MKDTKMTEDWKFVSAHHAWSESGKSCWIASDGTRISNEEYDDWLSKQKATAPVIPIEVNSPHKTSEVICIDCGKRWIAVRPQEVKLKDIQCPECTAQGFVIETGEVYGQG